MALQYLLDTNVLSALVRDPQGPVSTRIAAVGESAICASIVVAAELRFGAEKSGSTKLDDRVDAILSALEVLPLETPADAAVREAWEETGLHVALSGIVGVYGGPEFLVEYRPGTVVVMNPVYMAEIAERLAGLALSPMLLSL